MNLQVDRITAVTEWELLKDHWDSLAGRFPFRRWVWLRSWWDGYGSDHDLYVLCVRQGSEIVGLAPWCLRRSVPHGRVLMWIGGGKACADDMALLCQPGYERPVGVAVAQWLQAARGCDRWHMLDLDGISPTEPSLCALRDQFDQDGQSIRVTPQESCWSIAIPQSWEDYLRMPGKNSRRILRQLERQFVQSGRTAYRVAQDLGQAQWAYDKIRQLHQQRWQERGIAGCFSRPNFDRFLWSAAARLHAAGQLHAAWVELDGQIVAGSVGFVIDRTHSVYVSGMDTRLSECRPGWLLNQYHVRHAIEKGWTTVDFLRGDEPYKARMAAVARPQERWRAAPARPLAQVRYGAYWAGITVRDWWAAAPAVPTADHS